MEREIYNYATIHFLPYPETGEFVNLGIVAFRPVDGRLLWRLETRKKKRVTDFFPELDGNLVAEFVRGINRELRMINEAFVVEGTRLMPFERQHRMEVFRQLVRPREGMMRFGEISTGRLEGKPDEVIVQLFKHYVHRNFAQQAEYREQVMTRRLRQTFIRQGMGAKFGEDNVGNDLFHVRFPFVHRDGIVTAIKPLDLDKADSTRVFEHGDQWLRRLDRLQQMHCLPDRLLFAVRQSDQGKTAQAATEICTELLKIGNTKVVPATARDAILHFARSA